MLNGTNVTSSRYQSGVRILDSSVYTFYQIDGLEHILSGSIQNEAEANAVVNIVDSLRRNSQNNDWSSRVRIITFYSAQVTLIQRLLRKKNMKNVLVNTVDASQGSEYDVVILSFVRSGGKANRGTVGFLTDDRRLNVAMTRAKYQLIAVGNIQWMANLSEEKGRSVKRLAIDAIERGCLFSFPSSDNFQSNKRKPSPLKYSHLENGAIKSSIQPDTRERKKRTRTINDTKLKLLQSKKKNTYTPSQPESSRNSSLSSAFLNAEEVNSTFSFDNVKNDRQLTTSQLTTAIVADSVYTDKQPKTKHSIDCLGSGYTERRPNELVEPQPQSSELSKAETMAVFEEFTF